MKNLCQKLRDSQKERIFWRMEKLHQKGKSLTDLKMQRLLRRYQSIP